MDNIIISIIIPVYNAEAFIGRALDSCLQQSYANIEIVIVDDGSVDNSLDILRKYAADDLRVHVITGANSGVVVARETAVKNSHGEFLLFMDADDTLVDGCLQRMIACVDNETDMVIGDINQVEVSGSSSIIKYGLEGTHSGKEHFDWIVSNRVGFLWGKLIRRSLMDSIKVMPYGVKFCEDYIQMLQLSYHARKIVHVGTTAYNYIQQDESACNRALSVTEYAQRFTDLCLKLTDLMNLGVYDIHSSIKLKTLFLYYCRLYLCISGKWGTNKVLHSYFSSFIREETVKDYYKATDNRRYRMTLMTARLYPIIAFFHRKQLRKYGRIK